MAQLARHFPSFPHNPYSLEEPISIFGDVIERDFLQGNEVIASNGLKLIEGRF